MAKYRKKAVVINAITFDEFVEYGRTHGVNIVNGMPWSFKYEGHPITHENDQCYLIPSNTGGTERFTPEDMLITGVNGEIYPCPIDVFEKTYEKLSSVNVSFDFGYAVKCLKNGFRVARKGWNGKGMWLVLIEPGEYKVESMKFLDTQTYQSDLLPWIGMKTADKRFVPWLASQTDMLAEDWEIVE